MLEILKEIEVYLSYASCSAEGFREEEERLALLKGVRELMTEKQPLMTAREAANYLRISLATLGRIEKGGGLVPFRTPGKHRRYSLVMLNRYLESTREKY